MTSSSTPPIHSLRERCKAFPLRGFPYTDAERWSGRRWIAEAQFDLDRVRSSRRQLITRFLADPSYQALQVLNIVPGGRLRDAPIEVEETKEIASPRPLEGEEKLVIILKGRVSELAALDRYERRALSRRKIAILNFDAARTLDMRRRPYEI